nr:MAG TPA: hypothetical protein [Bacteriophage sp.]DAT53753.1 MAG TPA: hypothetical protein [Bacteriophage sp.]
MLIAESLDFKGKNEVLYGVRISLPLLILVFNLILSNTWIY